jgi:hypothetical protein
MPTKRTRTARVGRLLPEHIAWAAGQDADKLFTDPRCYGRSGRGSYGEVDRLPGVRPWWPPLALAWHYEQPPEHFGPHGGDWPKAREFVGALHDEYLATRSKRGAR